MRREHEKLVRDEIPALIRACGGTCSVRRLEGEEYLRELDRKLGEELKEYLESGEVEELADLEEVLLAILAAKGVSVAEFEELRRKKLALRGGFENGLFLEYTEE